MPKLYFRYGVMNSSKTANLLMVAYNYQTQGKPILLLKPKVDTRFKEDYINSRVGTSMKADVLIDNNTDLLSTISLNKRFACILVDECQFLSEKHIDQLRDLTEYSPVICYGLRTNHKSKLFPGSKRLMEIADIIEEIKTICVKCEKKAIITAKIDSQKNIVKEGCDDPDIGGEEKYQSMCFKCWKG